MILKELIKSVQKTDQNKLWIDIEELAHDLGISRDLTYSVENEQFPELIAYSTDAYWMCTDTMVGIEAYYLNDKLVAVSAQQGRKCDKEFEWVSKEKAEQVRDLILSRCSYELNIQMIDFNQDVTKWVESGECWRKHLERAESTLKI